MKNRLFADVGTLSLNKRGEQLCGDMVEIIRKENAELIVVLADGLGSGVKANILSTLTSKIISTMIAAGLSVDECVSTIAATLPVCQKRGVAYSTFTIMRFIENREVEMIQFDNPMVILLRNGKHYDYPVTSRVVEGKTIHETRLTLELNDVFIAMSDGAIYAGVGEVLNYGWQRENIITFIEERYNWTLTAKTITSLISDECNRLYAGRPGDDTTITTVQIRKRKTCNLMIGPPADKKDDAAMLSKFFSEEGKHIVCGGTSSAIAARYLGKEVIPEMDYFDPHIPPTAKIEGVDLVTEGVITISRVLEYARNYLDNNSLFEEWGYHQDGASQIARLLFQEATDVNFYAGRAINSAHQNPDLPITFSIKMRLIEELTECLKKMGKTVTIEYY
ncbi:SpoIIE family protein phosphatase [Ructibacterium gallinarum]|uniref:SpoIIE family protein phosphatase n=1 Tax=Ructibacterium gallinarum TaxID=2779355 RepID=A0A9D5M473_9FIRM|nr:SpoIIE family protein phosphatase [Ructibacterium gallinarum]MBE5039244.1 SpoIIE family protein phosphatase [Ructibacterium gallinarum]